MNWYKNIKTASKEDRFFEQGNAAVHEDSQAHNQVASYMNVCDVQKYVLDNYTVKVAISRTEKKLTVSISINHGFLGSIVWNQFWYYDVDEFDIALKTYKQLLKITEDTMSEFVEKEIPTPMFWAYIRKRTEDLDHDATLRSNVPSINYSEQYRHLMNPDWRSNLYGTRYPSYNEESFRQHKERNR